MIGHPQSERRRTRTGGVACFLGLLALANASPLRGQLTPTALITGRVVEAGSRQPIEGVSVRLDGDAQVAQTGEDGRFTFDAAPLGRHVLAIDHLPFVPVRDTLVLAEAGATYRVQISLSEGAIELEPILVTVHTVGGPLDDVEDRMERMRRLGLGDIFDRQAIERSGTSRVSHLVAQLPGARLQPIGGRAGAAELRLHAQNDCPPSFYMDGRQVQLRGAVLDDFVTLTDIAFVEVYRRMTALPVEFADEQSQYCGAVAVWTLRGADEGEAFGFGRMLAATAFAALAFIGTLLWCC